MGAGCNPEGAAGGCGCQPAHQPRQWSSGHGGSRSSEALPGGTSRGGRIGLVSRQPVARDSAPSECRSGSVLGPEQDAGSRRSCGAAGETSCMHSCGSPWSGVPAQKWKMSSCTARAGEKTLPTQRRQVGSMTGTREMEDHARASGPMALWEQVWDAQDPPCPPTNLLGRTGERGSEAGQAGDGEVKPGCGGLPPQWSPPWWLPSILESSRDTTSTPKLKGKSQGCSLHGVRDAACGGQEQPSLQDAGC